MADFMHLLACDQEGRVVSAKEASSKKNYFCLECGASVRRRAGGERIPHFFHFRSSKACHQKGKSLLHLQVQYWIQRQFPFGVIELEHPFSLIQRIGDVVWEAEKLIFEVQCSAISAEEILARQVDYQKVGFTVVWILHDTRYPPFKESRVQQILHSIPHYYTDIDVEGNGGIYDPLMERKEKEKIASKNIFKLPVDLALPMREACLKKRIVRPESLPAWIVHRACHWPLHFEGDTLHHLDQTTSSSVRVKELLEREITQEHFLAFCWKSVVKGVAWIKNGYQTLLSLFLEMVCR